MKPILIGIYRFVNTINGHSYTGQSNNIWLRHDMHLYYIRHPELKEARCKKFYNAVQSYGIENFKFEIIEQFTKLDRQLLNERETYWIVHFDSLTKGYNLTTGGDCCELSNETKERIRQSKTGEKNPLWGMVGIYNPFYGQHHTKEVKQFIASANTGRIISREARKKQSNAQRGKHWYNNGIEQHYWFPKDKLPGYKRGCLKSLIESNKTHGFRKGSHWYNNKIIEIQSEFCPDGFIKGRLSISNSLRKRHSKDMKGKHWFNNGKINRCEYICPKGFIPGKLTIGNEQRMIEKLQLSQVFKQGYDLFEGIDNAIIS
jgi:group I intron endonuclease